MSYDKYFRVQSYQDAVGLLTGRCKDSRRIAHNTYVERDRLPGDERIYIRLHNTRIVSYYPDGSFMLNTGGWDTVTTWERINRFTPESLSCSARFRSSARVVQWCGMSYEYDDYMRFWPDGIVTTTCDCKPVEVPALEMDDNFDTIEYNIRLSRASLTNITLTCYGHDDRGRFRHGKRARLKDFTQARELAGKVREIVTGRVVRNWPHEIARAEILLGWMTIGQYRSKIKQQVRRVVRKVAREVGGRLANGY